MIDKILSFLFVFAIINSAKSQISPLEINELQPGFFVCTTYGDVNGEPYPSNSLYALTSEGVILIDTPWDTLQILPLLDSIENRHHKKVVLCIGTHFHADRTGGFDILKRQGIKTYSSQRTLELCKEHSEKQAEYIFTKDTVFTIADLSFETFYPGPGHTEDNIIVWFPSAQILHGGCFIKSIESDNIGNLSDANLKEWPNSLHKLTKKYPDPRIVIPGHLHWSDKRCIRHTLSLAKKAAKE